MLMNSARAAWAQTPVMQAPAVQNQAQQGAAVQEPAPREPTGQGKTEPSQVESAQGVPAQPDKGVGVATVVAAAAVHPVVTVPGKRPQRQAEDAYLAGAKKLQQDDLIGAELEFARAHQLDPGTGLCDRDLPGAPAPADGVGAAGGQGEAGGGTGKGGEIARPGARHRPREPDCDRAQWAGFGEECAPGAEAASGRIASAQTPGKPGDNAGGTSTTQLADRARMLSGGEESGPWKIQVPELAGAIRLTPSDAVKSFDLREVSPDLIRDVASAYGIRAVVDDSVERKTLRFELENVNYRKAMEVLSEIANVIAVPLDETSVLVARNLPSNRQLMDPWWRRRSICRGHRRNRSTKWQTCRGTSLGQPPKRPPEALCCALRKRSSRR